MTGAITFENITFLIAIIGVIFGVYHFFRNPDIKNKEDIETNRLIREKEIEKLRSELCSFQELTKTIQNLSDNHLHTLESKLDGLVKVTGDVCIRMGKLETIIDERIPKK